MAVSVSSASSIFDQAFGDVSAHKANILAAGSSALRDHDVLCRCLVARDTSPRQEQFTYLREIGSAFIDDILYKRRRDLGDRLTFYFPECHMSQWEQQRFIWCVFKHPDFIGNPRTLDIVTGSPLVVSSFRKEEVRILRNDDIRAAQVAAWGV
jgi:hypothetical protein